MLIEVAVGAERRKPDVRRDAPAVARKAELSGQYPRSGCRRVGIFLCRDRYRIGVGCCLRLWQAGLQVPRLRPRRRVAASRPRPQTPTGPNRVSSHDIVFDRSPNGRQLECLAVPDDLTEQGLAIDWTAVSGRRGWSRCRRGSSGSAACRRSRAAPMAPKFASKARLSWIVRQGSGTALIEPGKP